MQSTTYVLYSVCERNKGGRSCTLVLRAEPMCAPDSVCAGVREPSGAKGFQGSLREGADMSTPSSNSPTPRSMTRPRSAQAAQLRVVPEASQARTASQPGGAFDDAEGTSALEQPAERVPSLLLVGSSPSTTSVSDPHGKDVCVALVCWVKHCVWVRPCVSHGPLISISHCTCMQRPLPGLVSTLVDAAHYSKSADGKAAHPQTYGRSGLAGRGPTAANCRARVASSQALGPLTCLPS